MHPHGELQLYQGSNLLFDTCFLLHVSVHSSGHFSSCITRTVFSQGSPVKAPTIYFLQAEVSVSLVQALSQCCWHSDSQDVHDSHSQAFCLLVL